MHEVSGRPKDFVEEIVNLSPKPNKLEEEISDEEYEATLNGLREEKEGIKQWLINGHLSFVLKHFDPYGSA